ncbi:uncharacterized protein LOC133285673 [Gastrolobium bilobum]|uniref:uncharacterized protein LOC133285673 n=1 Tax=Gastrolobium bilobum TaxID=150636 RepID=UPI002AB2149B|nr:uncharacterized protein LOC133285673 [Gastrolobium bilobum]
MTSLSSASVQEHVTEPIPVTNHSANRGNSSNYNNVFDASDPGSPHFLHPNENMSLVLVSSLMNGKNYHGWAKAMRMALWSKNKLSFVNGTITIPDVSDSRYRAWEQCNTMVLSWLHRSIKESISQSILRMDRACNVWNDLKERFSQSDVFKISNLQDDIHRIHKGDCMFSNYYTQLKILWDKLEALQPTPTCKYVHPCCNISSEVKKCVTQTIP